MSLENSKETSVVGAEGMRGEWWEVRAGGSGKVVWRVMGVLACWHYQSILNRGGT